MAPEQGRWASYALPGYPHSLQGAKQEFTNIVARWKGSTHDSRVFKTSSLYARFEQNEFNGVLIGDSGYECNRRHRSPTLSRRHRTLPRDSTNSPTPPPSHTPTPPPRPTPPPQEPSTLEQPPPPPHHLLRPTPQQSSTLPQQLIIPQAPQLQLPQPQLPRLLQNTTYPPRQYFTHPTTLQYQRFIHQPPPPLNPIRNHVPVCRVPHPQPSRPSFIHAPHQIALNPYLLPSHPPQHQYTPRTSNPRQEPPSQLREEPAPPGDDLRWTKGPLRILHSTLQAADHAAEKKGSVTPRPNEAEQQPSQERRPKKDSASKRKIEDVFDNDEDWTDVGEAVQLNVDEEGNTSTDLSVGIDGTWQKRGYSSLNGVVTVSCIDTGKILDAEVFSKYCHSCACKKYQVIKHLGLQPGKNCLKILTSVDKDRERKAEIACLEEVKQKRKRARFLKKKKRDEEKRNEPEYEAGMF
ncbi:circumsporozoite protein-like [Macrosteles quadrilineatus]|uniref:circumsporozoite protein-like n=1 Tax=Macrosteles quadrilineatus TaxID=74068 RepID=UPI0023E214F9|nr:circumsporozoite protein-like [Macrosteles quadrilineatus]